MSERRGYRYQWNPARSDQFTAAMERLRKIKPSSPRFRTSQAIAAVYLLAVTIWWAWTVVGLQSASARLDQERRRPDGSIVRTEALETELLEAVPLAIITLLAFIAASLTATVACVFAFNSRRTRIRASVIVTVATVASFVLYAAVIVEVSNLTN